MTKSEVEKWLLELMPHIMASGALHFASNRTMFVGSDAPLSTQFESAAESFMKYRGTYEIDTLLERVGL